MASKGRLNVGAEERSPANRRWYVDHRTPRETDSLRSGRPPILGVIPGTGKKGSAARHRSADEGSKGEVP